MQSTYIRAPGLIDLQQHANAWGTGAINPRRSGMVYAIDGRERWLVHNYMKPGEADFDAVDRDASIRTILGVGAEFNYDVISKEDWYGRRLIANRFRDRCARADARCAEQQPPLIEIEARHRVACFVAA